MRPVISAAVALFLTASTPASAQVGQTSALMGRVTRPGGAPSPGVAVTVTSEALPGGTLSAVTNASGTYVFAALPPGVYLLRAELGQVRISTGYRIELQIGQTAVVNVEWVVGGAPEQVLPVPPEIDGRSAVPASHLSMLLGDLPFATRRSFDAALLAPGIGPNDFTAYGTAGGFSNAYLIDGGDASDPAAGGARAFSNQNWVQDVRTTIGADADSAGFTGALVQAVLRSGTGHLHMLAETLFSNDALESRNLSTALLRANGDLAHPILDYETTDAVQAGGPLRRDRAWFFAGLAYRRARTVPPGYPALPPPEISGGTGPRARADQTIEALFKPTLAPGLKSRLTGFAVWNRETTDGFNAAADRAAQATLRRTAPAFSWNADYTRLLTASSIVDVQYSGFHASEDREPYNGTSTPGWYDLIEEVYSVNADSFSATTAGRQQVNAQATKYVSALGGEHGLKAGGEFERSPVNTTMGLPGGVRVLAFSGIPGFGEFWAGSSTDTVNGRVALFVQDAWSITPTIALSAGVRYTRATGRDGHLARQVLASDALAPRVGVAWNVGGNSRTVVRGHYGWYHDGLRSVTYDLVDPEIHPQYSAPIDAALHVAGPLTADAPGTNRTVGTDIGLPRMKQAVGSIQHELGRGLVLGATGIYRDYDRFIDDVLVARPGDFTSSVLRDPGPDGLPGTGDETSVAVSLYRQLTDPLRSTYLITNPAGAVRRYRGVELTAEHRRGPWQLQTSWVISKTTGTYDNLTPAPNSPEYDDPNTDSGAQPLRSGRPTSDHTHVPKVLRMCALPWSVHVSGVLLYTTGDTYSRTIRSPRIPQGRIDLFIEPRGSQRLPDQPRLDLKVEKRFGRDQRRLGVTVEAFNVFNNAAIIAVATRSGSLFGRPLGIVAPRRLRLGAVWRF